MIFEHVDLRQVTWRDRALNEVEEIGVCVTVAKPGMGFLATH